MLRTHGMVPRVSVLIPTHNGGGRFRELLQGLQGQRLRPIEIIVTDSSSADDTAQLAQDHECTVEVIPQERFDHAATRNAMAAKASGDILVFMTQDAIPYDEWFLQNLVGALHDDVAAAYARHVPDPDARPTDAFHRQFNYPDTGHRVRNEDVAHLGVRAYFFSNAAAAYRADVFHEQGGFAERLIQSEDVHLCARLLHAGHAVAYAADARVRHSHRLSLRAQFKRYFDTGAAYALSPMPGARTTGEGWRFVKGQTRYLARRAPMWLPYAWLESGCKFLGFHLGKRHALIPRWLRARLSGRPEYWREAPPS